MRRINESAYFNPRQLLLVAFMALLCTTGMYAEVSYEIPLNAKEHQIGNMLEWSTSMEINSHNFEIEKSIDGIQFDNIGLLEAAGMSEDGKSYRFLDVGVNNEKIFYRLKQIDFDGAANLSQTVLVNKLMPNQFMVVAMTNTTFDKTFQITVDIIVDTTIEYDIYTMKGVMVKQGKEELTYGLNDILLNLEDEKEGYYKVILRIKDEEENLVIMKTDDPEKKRDNVASQSKQNGG